MVLDIIKQEIILYKKLINAANYDELYKWEALKIFQKNWDIEAVDFKSMFENSIHHKRNNLLWAGQLWFPKAVMLRFIEHDKERVRQMFYGLYNEEEEIDKRIERFVFHCDKIREEVYKYDNTVKHHFHDGQRMVTLYLAFRFPEKYAIYKFTEFRTFMEKVKASDIPGTGEFTRFFRVVRTLYGILQKDKGLIKLHKSILSKDCYKGETLILAQDFIFKIARYYMNAKLKK